MHSLKQIVRNARSHLYILNITDRVLGVKTILVQIHVVCIVLYVIVLRTSGRRSTGSWWRCWAARSARPSTHGSWSGWASTVRLSSTTPSSSLCSVRRTRRIRRTRGGWTQYRELTWRRPLWMLNRCTNNSRNELGRGRPLTPWFLFEKVIDSAGNSVICSSKLWHVHSVKHKLLWNSDTVIHTNLNTSYQPVRRSKGNVLPARSS